MKQGAKLETQPIDMRGGDEEEGEVKRWRKCLSTRFERISLETMCREVVGQLLFCLPSHPYAPFFIYKVLTHESVNPSLLSGCV